MGFFDRFSLTAFTALSRSEIAGVFVLDKIAEDSGDPHSALFNCDLENAWERAFVNERIAGAAIAPFGDSKLVLLSQWGKVHALSSAGLQSAPGVSAARGPMMRLRSCNGALYAVGSSAQAFQWTSQSEGWLPFGPEAAKKPLNTIFTDIDGFSEDELYVSGTQGEIWRVENGVWNRIPCATNLAFHAIHCSKDGHVYACGQLGILARGRGDRFEILSPDTDPLVDLWGIAELDGRIFCSGFRVLLEYVDERLKPHMPAMSLSAYFYGLEACDGVLWACGEKSILRFDGSRWDVAHDLNWIPLEQ